jgi:hypothetical protein
MWLTKTFKTRKAMDTFISKHERSIQWVEIFINNGYCIEYRRLHRVY